MKKIKLFCFPYAGASATIFNKWKKRFVDIEIVPIELSGRGIRMNEPLYKTFDEAVDDAFIKLIKEINNDSSEYALFGHSMGGMIVFELAHRIYNENYKMPKKIFISGSSCPTERENNQTHLLPDRLFYKEVIDLGGTNALVFENDELINIFGPILRADYKITEMYKTNIYNKLSCDLHILYGNTDLSGKGEKLKNWKDETNGNCYYQDFKGGHFFILEQELEVINYLKTILATIN